ncbi:MAG: metallophosphoesterase family protein [Patescibacteria group bacterium]
MKLAIFSDTHDSFENISKAIKLSKEEGAGEMLIHCGDICAPVTLAHIIEEWPGEIHYCFGNVDGDHLSTFKVHKDNPSVHGHGESLGSLNAEGKSIAFQHYPELARRLAESGAYDAVFYGHTHLKHNEYIGKTLLANPGNVCGIKHPPSFAIYDTESNTLEHIDL